MLLIFSYGLLLFGFYETVDGVLSMPVNYVDIGIGLATSIIATAGVYKSTRTRKDNSSK